MVLARAQGLMVALLLVSVALAGCAAPTSEDDAQAKVRAGGRNPNTASDIVPVDWAERALPSDVEHAHSDAASHQGLSTPNFEVVGYNPLIDDYHGRTSGGYGCSDVRDDGGRRLSITASFTTDVGLIVSDVTDATNPEKIGELALSSTQLYDNALTPDMRFALLATSPYESGPEAPEPLDADAAGGSRMEFRDACTGDVRAVDGPEQGAPYAAGLLLVNLENPRAPFVEDFRPLPLQGAHSIRAFDVEGRTVLLASVSATGGAEGYWMFLEIAATPAGNRIIPISVYYPPEHLTYRSDSGMLSVHDGTLQKHPVTGEWIAYLSDIFYGGWLVNVDDLSQPRLLSHWDPKPTFGRDMIVHGIQPIEGTWDGRHYSWIHEETFGRPAESPTGWLIALDTTDPEHPKTVSAWTLPVDVSWRGDFQFSLHYTAIVNRTVFVAMYHGGVWAIDASTLQALVQPAAVGVFVPDRVSPKPPGPGSNVVIGALISGLMDNTPVVADVNALPDGTLIAYDAASGLYMFRFHEDVGVPKPEPWPTSGLKFR